MKSFMALYKSIKRVIIHPFLFLLLYNSYSQENIVHQFILNESFGSAYKTLDQFEDNSPYQYLFMAYSHSLELLLFENQQKYTNYNSQIGQWEKECTHTADTSKEHYFSLSCITMLQGVINYNYGNKLGAFFMLKKAKRLAEKSIKKHPDFIENQLLYGLLNISLGLIPEKYTWIATPLGYKGEFKLGLQALLKYKEENGLFKKEAALIIQLLNTFLLEGQLNTSALAPSTSLEELMTAAIYLKSNRAEKALILIKNSTSKAPVKKLLWSEACLLTGKYKDASLHVQEFLSTTKGNNYIKAALRIQYLAGYLGNFKLDSAVILTAMKEKGTDIMAKDKEALSFANSPTITDKNLFEARILFDGGAFQKALEIVEKCDDSIEKSYRKARILHLLGKYNKALELYKKVLKTGQNGQYYIANASLQLAYIYHQQNKKDQTIFYLQKARKLHGEAYDEGINMKAKLALDLWYDQ